MQQAHCKGQRVDFLFTILKMMNDRFLPKNKNAKTQRVELKTVPRM